MKRLYKVLSNGKSCHGGSFTWSLPTQNEDGSWTPGAWHEVDGVSLCRSGFHLTTDPTKWATVTGMEVYEAEAIDISDYWEGDKCVCRRVRLVRRLTTVIELSSVRIALLGKVRADGGVWFSSGSAIVEAYGNAIVRAYGSSTVEAYDDATVEAYGNAIVRAYGKATVMAYDSATVEASGSATVRASGKATVRAYGSATVEASGKATVMAYGGATIEAYGGATIEAYDSATVRASGKATVRAYGGATIEAYGGATIEAYDSATVEASGIATVVGSRWYKKNPKLSGRSVFVSRADGEIVVHVADKTASLVCDEVQANIEGEPPEEHSNGESR